LRFTYVSNRYRDVAGVSAEVFHGKRWEEVYPRSAKRQADAWRAFFGAVKGRKDFRDFIHDDFRQNGQRRVIRNTGKAIFAPDGTFSGYRGASTDITKQVQVEEELRRSEEQIRDMTANLPGIVYQFTIDAEGSMSFPYVSPAIETILGLDPAEVVSDADTWFEIVHPEDRPGLEASIQEAHRTLEPWLWEGRMIRRSGEIGWFRGTSISRRLEDGSVLWNGIVLDITERRAAEQALRESEARFKAVIENSPSGIYLKDLDGRYLLINQRCTQWYGPTQADAHGKTHAELYPDEDAAGIDVRDAEVLRNGAVVEWETAFVHQDGGLHDTWMVKAPVFDEQGEIVGICGINTDITRRKRAEAARKESEQRLRSVVDNSPSAIYLKDPEGRFRMVNRRFEVSYGVTAPEVTGKTTDEFLPGNYAERFMALDRLVLRTGNIEEHEVESPFADGSLHQLLTTKFPVRDADGRIIGVGTIDTDVTERKRAEAGQRASEALFKAFVEHSPTPISIKDLAGRYSVFSPAAKQYYDAPVEQAVGKFARDLFPPDLAAVIEADDQAIIRSETSVGRDEERVRDYGDASLLLTK
ncbi:MAG: PAS domain S-box protein, partial [bacterium]|nr:PAS domain S-box protein [bacterium]